VDLHKRPERPELPTSFRKALFAQLTPCQSLSLDISVRHNQSDQSLFCREWKEKENVKKTH